jgi:hypothetical protein
MDQQASPHREIATGARVAPPPAWADLEPYDIPASPNPHFVASGLCVLLDDSQIDLTASERVWFYRRAELVTAIAGAERAAQFNVSFDPAFERVEVHNITVIRKGQRIEYADKAFFEVLRRERNMERLIFDGAVTLAVTLPDVHAGDVVETAYSLIGGRKSLGGKHAAFIGLEWPVGIIDVRLRQRRPEGRAVYERGYNNPPEAREASANGMVDRRWRMRERPGFKFEPLAPPWEMQCAALQLTEWREWREVADTFTPLYEDDGPLPDDVEREVQRIASAETTQAGRAAAVLRFTQNAVRYLAISMGEGGYTPRALADIGATKYGDCKDKSKLFTQMARKLGLDACPALVNTRDGYALERYLPSAQIFDHCIVRLSVDGKIYWLDPTRTMQPSPLDTLNQCHFGWALPLKAGVTALERMPDPTPVNTQETVERITLGKSPKQPVRYEWKITSRRGRAEWVREAIAREGMVGLFKLYADDIGRRFAGAKPLRQDLVEDDTARNALTALEVYEIENAWHTSGRMQQFATHDLTMRAQLAPLDASVAKLPIYLGQVGSVTRRVELELPYDVKARPWTRSVESSSLMFKSEFKREGPKHFTLTQSLEFRALTLPAAEADKYRQVIAELDQSDIVFSGVVGRRGAFVGTADDMEVRGDGNWVGWAIGLAVGAAYLVYRYFERAGLIP